MASNLKSAKQAIKAELSHAKQGIAYYTARVQALESTLHQLESVEDDVSTSTRGEKPQANAKNIKATPAKRGRKPRGAADANGGDQGSSANGTSKQRNNKAKRRPRITGGSNDANGLPSTGSDFWLSLVSNQPQSAVDIANAAGAALGIKPDQKKQIQKLKQRVSPALAGLVSTKKIKDSGSGRERRFFRNDNQSA